MNISSEAEFIAPIAYGNFELGDFLEGLNEDSIFQTGDDNELIFTYKTDNIATVNFDDFVDIPSEIQLVNKEISIGNIELKPYSFRENLTLSELKQRLSNNAIVNLLPDNSDAFFPEIILGNESSENLMFEIQDFEFMEYGHFVDGEITCVFQNNFPTNCAVSYQLIDAEGQFLEEISFGTNSSTGVAPQESEVKVIDLTGRSIRAPLYYKITLLHFFESESSVYIQSSNSLKFNAELSNMLIDEGIIKSESFTYETEPEQIDFEIGDTIHITRAIFEEANLSIEIQKTFVPNGELTIYFPYLYENGESYEITLPLTGNNYSTFDFDLSGSELVLYNEQKDYNSIEFYIAFETIDDGDLLSFRADDLFKFDFSLSDLSFSYIEGDFGNLKFDISQEGVGVDPELWNNISGNLFGQNPTMKLLFSNPVGIPALFDVQIDASNLENENVSLTADPYILVYPKNVEEAPMYSELEFNSSNSSIYEFVQLPPNNEINFEATIELNPRRQGTSPLTNFVLLSEPFQIGLEIEIPLLLHGTFFELSDTIPLNLSTIDDLIERAEIIFQTENSMPLQVDLKVFPFDTISNTTTGSELLVTILEAARVDKVGNVLGSTEAENSLLINNESVQSLSIANSLLVNAKFLSPNNGESPAKLKNEYGFDMEVILDVKPNL